MPVAKGKKKSKRERRRFGSASPAEPEDRPVQSSSSGARPVRRRGWQGPPWLNLALGVIMIVGGVAFASLNHFNLLILIAYWFVGGFYLWRYYRQMKQKRSS